MEDLLHKVNKYKRVLNESLKDEQKILQILQKLDWMPISFEVLQATEIGKTVNSLRKSEGRVGEQARALVVKWKKSLESRDSPSAIQNKQPSAKPQEQASASSSKSRPETPLKHKLDSSSGISEKKIKVEHNGSVTENRPGHKSSQRIDSDIGDSSAVTSVDGGKHKSSKSHHHSRPDHNGRASSKSVSSSGNSSASASKSSQRGAERGAGKHNNDDDESASDVNNIEENGMSFDDFMSFDNPKKKSSTPNMSDIKTKVKASDSPAPSPKKENSIKNSTSERSGSSKSSEKDKKQLTKESTNCADKDNLRKESKNKESSYGDSGSKTKSEKKSGSNDAASTSKQSRDSVKDCDVSDGKKSSKDSKNNLTFVPKPQQTIVLKEADILATLPDISPNYHPLPQSLRNKTLVDTDDIVDSHIDDAVISAKKQSKTKVYAGKTHAVVLRSVPKLFDRCIQVLRENIDYLGYVGGIPASVLLPVLERCSAVQLYHLEDMNVHFIGDTEELWKLHCSRDFKGFAPREMESWRELYLRMHDEREEKLKKLTVNIQQSTAKKDTGRKAKLAFVDSYVKPPRDVRRQQEKNGTAFVKKLPLPNSSRSSVSLASAAAVGNSLRMGSSLTLAPACDGRAKKPGPKVAPMMAKTLKMMKNWSR